MAENKTKNNLQESPTLKWFRNAILGATMADQPAMMTASGWRLNENGDYVLDLQDNPEVKELRDNLASEAVGVIISEYGVPALLKLSSLGLKGLRGMDNPNIFLNIESVGEKAKNTREAVLNSLKGRRLAEETVNSPVVLQTKNHNTALYKRATGKDANYKYKSKADANTRVLSNEDFNNSISLKNTNAEHLKSVENVGGYYNPEENMVVLRNNTPISNAFHEHLHGLKYGESPATEWIANFLWENPSKVPAYYKMPGETATLSLLLGKSWGLELGLKYPGDKVFDELAFEHGIGGAPHYFKRTTSKDKKRFWKAITGQLFGLGTLYGINKNN